MTRPSSPDVWWRLRAYRFRTASRESASGWNRDHAACTRVLAVGCARSRVSWRRDSARWPRRFDPGCPSALLAARSENVKQHTYTFLNLKNALLEIPAGAPTRFRDHERQPLTQLFIPSLGMFHQSQSLLRPESGRQQIWVIDLRQAGMLREQSGEDVRAHS